MSEHLPQDPICLELYGPHDPRFRSCAGCNAYRRVREDERHSVIHACPPEGSGVMPCCGCTPFEVPLTHRLTLEPDNVTCGKNDPHYNWGYVDGSKDARAAALRDAVEAVKAADLCGQNNCADDAVAAIEALGGQP